MVDLKEVFFSSEETLKLKRSVIKFLFKNYDLSSINEPSLYDFCVSKSNLKAFSNLLNLKELNFFIINFENISISELFCASHEYKIKNMRLEKINISEKDLIFIANLKNLKKLEFEGCYVQQKTYLYCMKMLFINEFYIEPTYFKFYGQLSEETIQFINEAFKDRNSHINVI
ncbi:hypothetical protein CWI39_1221p0020 [Hamiltosporidium magnivora]|uniref:Leucine-rich repeat-containing protein n=1 Tax=Hamiltosporidium magnivora TaxID=148818 RepID=A0A4Q9L3W4_9MICR|nr:hypothetical protein CWI39_1221p0020 [Hamiltosporidium magnivora]